METGTVQDPNGSAAREPALRDIRVLDFTHAAAGPFATMFLADMGAEVIKIEKPGRGDGARHMGTPMFGPVDSDYYLSLNRTKRSVLVDLGTETGRELTRRLAAECDVVIQNFRPGVMERLGLSFAELATLREGLVYCSISAFGPSGPWRDRPANDIIMQSVSGLMGITGEVDGGPVRIGAAICDYSTGLFALAGVLAALRVRDLHPEGQHIEVSMLDSAIAMMSNYIPSVMNLGATIPRLGRGHAQLVPYQAFECADGEYVMVGAFTSAFWRRLCEAVGRDEWLEDKRFATNGGRLQHRDYLLSELEVEFTKKPREDWLKVLDKFDVPNSPVLELPDALQLEQVQHNHSLIEIEGASGTVTVARNPIRVAQWDGAEATMPPVMGEHTTQVLTHLLGMNDDEIDALVRDGVIANRES